MRRPHTVRTGLGFLAALALGGSSALTVMAAAPPSTEDVIVVLRDGGGAAATVAEEHTRAHGAAVDHVYDKALRGYAARLPAGRRAALERDPRVAFVADDRPVRIAPEGVGRPDDLVSALTHTQSIPTGIRRIVATTSSTKAGNGSGSVNVAVAVIDTGITLTHPDLNVVGGKNCATGTTTYADGNGHGTHVAGTIAARDNVSGVVGAAPGAPLYAVRVLNNTGSGSTSNVICGIDWVTANAARLGIKVANLSLGGPGADDGNCGRSNGDAMHRAICNSVAAGVTYVVAAGNESVNFAKSTPAAYNEVLTVTAMSDFNGLPGGGARSTCRVATDDRVASFSNYTMTGSADAVHTIAAPGDCIQSTYLNRAYATMSGTSMASPHVAGTAALCIAGPCAGMTPAQVMAKLRADAAARPSTTGFVGDPNRPLATTTGQTRYYGYLSYAGGY